MDKIKDIIALRQELHKYPELSNKEFETAKRICTFMGELFPDKVIGVGKTGKAFVFDSGESGETLMFRAELDALPINEMNSIDYISDNKGVAHSCGHDGHMSILAGLATKIAENRPQKGRVVFLFQPAEEVEQGARDVVHDQRFKEIEPDCIFALHNIPGIPKHEIVIKRGSFAAASKGMTIRLFGKTSHAAEPENGINPSDAVSRIIAQLHELRDTKNLFEDLILLTFIHINLGEIAFGTSAGYAEMRITLRAFENSDMQLLTQKSEEIIRNISDEEKLKCKIEYSEIFPATVNDDTCFEMITHAAQQNGLPIRGIEKPFKWSEDFAYYTEKFKGGFFGLGAGETQPGLHNPDYNFPDDILETGINMFYSIYKQNLLTNLKKYRIMLDIQLIKKNEDFKSITRDEFIDFLFTHLDRFGDPKKDINKCLSYAFSDEKSEGGFALAAFFEGKLAGALIMNKTGMGDYIPDWILVYVAVDASYRGKGFGSQIIKEAFKHCDGNVKLHVEYDNPAKRLYERLGFTSKYAEMRYINK